jgi:hypothetical protein
MPPSSPLQAVCLPGWSAVCPACLSVRLSACLSALLIRFDDPARPSSRREFATDGTRLCFTIAEHESDIWVMELLPR